MPTGAQLIVDLLEERGVEVCFGLPGVHNLALWEALRGSSIRLVHEEGLRPFDLGQITLERCHTRVHLASSGWTRASLRPCGPASPLGRLRP